MRNRSLRRFKEKDVRKAFVALLGGKMLGIVAILSAVKGFGFFFGSVANAAPIQGAAEATDQWVSPINTMWVLVTAFLVFFMQAGFMALEAGFARSRESVNIMMECIFDTCLCGLLYFAVGFAFQFGTGNGFIGHSNFFLQG
ncbi:MAG: ammonium transporter, Amt family, partial [Acidimicrobiaceae bacterium]